MAMSRLPSTYLSANPVFTLTVNNFTPRWLESHPYTNQNTLYLARGPIIYCAEDAHHPWEANHFRDIVVESEVSVVDETRTHKPSEEKYVALKTTCWKRDMGRWTGEGGEAGPVSKAGKLTLLDDRELVYVPYYMRANSGGKGHVRVGMIKG
jgi:hypothetical protein